jgi:hypothetical protein
MTTAFQASAFQAHGTATDAFQIDGVTPPPVTPVVPTPAGIGKRRRRHRITVEIDGEVFEVSSLEEGRALLMRARAAANAAAQALAAKAAAKAGGKTKPAAVERAFVLKVPQVRVAGEAEWLQALQASAEAAQADLDAIYAAAMIAARRHYEAMQQDEDEALTMLLLH